MNGSYWNSEKIRNWVCCVLSILVAVGLVIFHYTTQKQEQEQQAARQQAAEEIEACEEELREAEQELSDLQAAITYTSDTAKIMIGFVVSESSGFKTISRLSGVYGFEPVLVLDCSEDMETLTEQIDTAAELGWEIMLGTRSFSDEMMETVISVQKYLTRNRLGDTGVFFLRNGDYSTANVGTLTDRGFIGYTRYHDTPTDGCTEDDIVYFDYSYIQETGTSVANRLASAASSFSSLIIVFDLDALYGGSISETYIEEVLELALYYTEQEACTFSSVEDVVAELSQINAIEAERQEVYEEESVEIQERIDEIKERLNELYGQED